MNVTNLLKSVNLYGPISNIKLAKNRVDEWFRAQKQPLLCLTESAKYELSIGLKAGLKNQVVVNDLIDYIARKTIFPEGRGVLERLETLLEKKNCTLVDYNELIQMGEACCKGLTSNLDNAVMYWCQENYLKIYHTNLFIEKNSDRSLACPIIHFGKQFHDLALTPIGMVIVSRIFIFIYVEQPKETKSAELKMNKIKISDEFLTEMLSMKKLSKDPSLIDVIDQFLKLCDMFTIDNLLNEIVANPIPPLEVIEHNFLIQNIFPCPKSYSDFCESSDSFNYDHPFDATEMFKDLKRGFIANKDKICGVYQLITAKLKSIREESPLRGRIPDEKLLKMMPLPSLSYEEYLQKFNLFLDYTYETELSKRIKSIEESLAKSEIEPDHPIFNEAEQKPLVEESPTSEGERLKVEGHEPAQEVDLQSLIVPVSMTPALQVDPRVTRWFDPAFDLTSLKEYQKVPPKKYEKIKFIHNFASIVNEIAVKYGQTFMRDNGKGVEQKMISMLVQAETPFSTNPVYYTLTMTFDKDDILFHRTLTQKSQGDLIEEMIEKGRYEAEFPPLSSFKKAIEIDPSLKAYKAEDGSYIKAVDGCIITVADPKWPQADGKPTLLHLIVV